MKKLIYLCVIILLIGCNENQQNRQINKIMDANNLQLATFAGGCFWCVEAGFEKLDGVYQVISGYTGGQIKNPSYEQVSAGTSGHIEVVQVHYDPNIITYATLLEVFWRQIDPTDNQGQFVDRGSQYRPAIFYHNHEQKKIATESRDKLAASNRFQQEIVTDILALEKFYPAEDYHQDYYQKNPVRYKLYRYNSGRDQFLTQVWQDDLELKKPQQYNKPAADKLQQQLTDLQYQVTQHDTTERPFQNKYWDNKQAGIYVDIVSGEPLFSSLDKFDSGTGWPSFTLPLDEHYIIEKQDFNSAHPRTEVRSQYANSHLGHVFPDGPTGLRYCINSAALRFIPKAELAAQDYERFLPLFEE